MTTLVQIDGIKYTYETFPKKETKYISLKDLPDFQKGKIYGGKKCGSDHLIQLDNGDFVRFFDKEMDEYFITEQQFKLRGKLI